MDFINFATVFLFLQRDLNSKVCADVFTSRESKTWTEASQECTLATPNLNFDGEITVTDIPVTITDDVWLGYFRQKTIFQYKGCQNENDLGLTTTHYLPQNSPGRCASACREGRYLYVGLQDKQCYCVDTNIDLQTTGIQCNDECAGQNGVACGDKKRISVSVYSVSDWKISQTMRPNGGDCLRIEPGKTVWAHCMDSLLALCSDDNNRVVVVDDQYFKWIKSSNRCFEKKLMPANMSHFQFYNRTTSAWSGVIQSDVVCKQGEGKQPSNQAEYMFLTTDNKVKFTDTGMKKYLCLNDPLSPRNQAGAYVGVAVGISLAVLILIVIIIGVVKVFLRAKGEAVRRWCNFDDQVKK